MKVYNIHERNLQARPEDVGGLIDGLSGQDDMLWPTDRWPAMEFDSSLREGAKGGHGPVRYSVHEYVPGQRVAFRFDENGLIGGIDGRHLFEVVPRRTHVVLRHIVDAECDFTYWLKWHFIVGPLHDALLEDSLNLAEYAIHGGVKKEGRWSPWVRFLRWMMARQRKKQAQKK
jgi:hypothetical protein